jgi:tetrahydromethanopterin S-methyltransferase subunit D
MASIFDISHDTGHGIAGLLGVGGFPVAALLLSVGLGHIEAWHGIKKTLLGIANLSWISVVLLAATLTLMTMQLSQASGGHLPQHARNHCRKEC